MREAGRCVFGSACLVAAFVLAVPSVLLAQEEAEEGPARGRDAWELNAFVGLLNDEPEFDPDGRGDDQFRRDAIVGARVGYTFPFNAFFQLQASNSLVRVQGPAGPTRNVNSFLYELAVGYNVQIRDDLQIFPAAGLGVGVWDPDGVENSSELVLNYGLGGRYFLARWLAVRGDARMHQATDGMNGYRGQLGTPLEDEDLYALELSIGVSLFLGR